jgi:hypothetical protein
MDKPGVKIEIIVSEDNTVESCSVISTSESTKLKNMSRIPYESSQKIGQLHREYLQEAVMRFVDSKVD